MKSDSTTTSNDADLLDDYVLSKSYVSADGEAVRSMCLMESSVVSTDEDNSTSTLLVVGSQGGWITTYSAATTIATTTIEPVHSFQGGHSHAITALISYEMDTFVSGCKDAIIRVFRLSCATTTTNDGINSSATNTPSSITQLVGHTNAVMSFSFVYFKPHCPLLVHQPNHFFCLVLGMVLQNYGTTVPASQPWKAMKIQYASRDCLHPLIPTITKIVTTTVTPIDSITLPQLLLDRQASPMGTSYRR
jgi:hypothetical protein